MKCEKVVIEKYLLEDDGGKLLEAEIIIVDGKFDECNFSGLSAIYDYDDWMFLKAVAEKIKSLNERNETKNNL